MITRIAAALFTALLVSLPATAKDCPKCRPLHHLRPALVVVDLPTIQPVHVVTFDGHRVKKVVEKVKALRAKMKPAEPKPEVKPEAPKPAVKPSVKGNHRGPLSRLRSRFGRRNRPDGPSDGPSDHPSLKPVPSEKLPLPKPSKVPGVPDKPHKPIGLHPRPLPSLLHPQLID